MSLKKTYMQTKPECKVTFKLEKDIVRSANEVNLVGEFNNWDEKGLKMKKLKSGDFSLTISLEKDKEYQFRYLLDSEQWVNEPQADKYIPNRYFSENSVIVI